MPLSLTLSVREKLTDPEPEAFYRITVLHGSSEHLINHVKLVVLRQNKTLQPNARIHCIF